MAEKYNFVLSDESVNSYGFRVLTEGIDLTRFEQNPVALLQHDDDLLPIGRWEDIKKQDGRLIASLVLDEKDEKYTELKNKLDGGFLKAASVGIFARKTSSEPQDILPNQTYETVTESEIFEASIVSIPSNKNALRLAFDSSNQLGLKRLSTSPKNSKKTEPKPNLNMELVLTLLGVDSEKDAVAKVKELQAENSLLSQNLAKLQEQQQAAKIAELSAMLDKKGVVGEEKATYLGLAETEGGFEKAKNLLQFRPDYIPATTQLAANSGAQPLNREGFVNKYEGETLLSISKKDPDYLKELEANHPKEFEKLLNRK